MEINVDSVITFLKYIIDGGLQQSAIHYMNIVMTNFNSFIMNNFAFLWIFAVTWQKYAEKTDADWDNRLSGKLVSFLSRFRNRNPPESKGINKGS